MLEPQSLLGRCTHGVLANSVGVLGAGGTIGSAVVCRLVESGAATEVYVCDEHRNVLEAHVIDIAESAVLSNSETTLTAVTLEAMPSVDVLVVAAAVPENPQAGRRASLVANCALVHELLPHMVRILGERGVLLLVTNPVDVVAEFVRRQSDVAAHRIIGYTLNDTIRFRIAVARELDVAPARVRGWVLGEHGGIQVPVFSQLHIDGERVALTGESRARIHRELRGWFARWAQLTPGRSSGWCTTHGLVHVLRGLAHGDELALSAACEGSYELPASFVSVPVALGRVGVQSVKPLVLDEEERTSLIEAASAVRDAADEVMRVTGAARQAL